MNFRKSLLPLLATLVLITVGAIATATPAFAYEGGWYTDNNLGGSEVLYLGDNSNDTYLLLRGASGYCGSPGASYAKMRRIIGNEYDQITWWIDQTCNDNRTGIAYARVCVENYLGQSACSTYRYVGWE